MKLKSENQSIEHYPLMAIPLKNLCNECASYGKLSTKLNLRSLCWYICQKNLFNENKHRSSGLLFQLNQPVIGHRLRGNITTMSAYAIDIKTFQIFIPAQNEHDKYGDYFSVGETALLVFVLFCHLQLFFLTVLLKMRKSPAIWKISTTSLSDNIAICSCFCTISIQKEYCYIIHF